MGQFVSVLQFFDWFWQLFFVFPGNFGTLSIDYVEMQELLTFADLS
jgi:hypothetical protein